MSDRTTRVTRRTVLKTAGVAATAAAVPTVLASESGWTSVASPTGNTLYDVEYTAEGAYAVGAGGLVLERTSKGWRKVLDGGPTGNGNSLYGADVTDDGQRLWFAGSSGAIGAYDVQTGNLENYSAPMDVTNNFNDIAVTGRAGEANVYVAGDSGKMYYSFENGEEGSWEYVTPASGSNINAVDFYDEKSGHIVDGNKTVLHTQDGATWNKIGLADANVNFYGVDSDGPDDVWVSGGGGMVFHWDGVEWTPTDTGDAGLRDLEVADGEGLTVGGGGEVYDYDGSKWTADATPTGQNLKALVQGDPPIAVGAGGTIVEYR
ncbi:hypothetical protein [Halorhabdus sp. BNX81]|uniref:WD40/YVTN/BNR-like repeat-containing protein n=1 Tax=Halorhabdus sp. BNX81 TaxID=2980181 RepID=UPI0023DD029C|nr:hypothetical protein [Halorhabdus sp. BNX81]WEL20962.1 hypothetical protein HBNXHr_0893 [Halorhabdus sp. BNX81]